MVCNVVVAGSGWPQLLDLPCMRINLNKSNWFGICPSRILMNFVFVGNLERIGTGRQTKWTWKLAFRLLVDGIFFDRNLKRIRYTKYEKSHENIAGKLLSLLFVIREFPRTKYAELMPKFFIFSTDWRAQRISAKSGRIPFICATSTKNLNN